MQSDAEPTVRRKKNFRARGSRGGARRKRNNQAQQMSYPPSTNGQYFGNGYAPHSHSNPRQYQRNHHHQQYYYNQANSVDPLCHGQQQNHAHSNTYASMAYKQDLSLSQSWSSATISSKENADQFTSDTFTPKHAKSLEQRESILPETILPESILPHMPSPAPGEIKENEHDITKQISMSILPMQKFGHNQMQKGPKDQIFGDSFLRKPFSEISINDDDDALNSAMAVHDESLTSNTGEAATKSPSASSYFEDKFLLSEGFDFFSTMHPSESRDPTSSERDTIDISHLASRCSGESYFVTSPRSFLMGKAEAS